MTTARYRMLLRTMYASVLNSRLSTGELQSLAEELRRGQLTDDLAYMISQALNYFGEGDDAVADDDRLTDAILLVRQNKITKNTLTNILRSLGYQNLNPKESSQSMLRQFISTTSSAKISKLLDILKMNQTGDKFLHGISEGRK